MATKKKTSPFSTLSILLLFITLLVLVNLLYVNMKIGYLQELLKEKTASTNTPVQYNTVANQCPTNCLSKIEEIKKTIDTLSVQSTKTQNTTQVIQSNGPKEYFVAFGSGTSSSGDWQDVSGLQAYVNKQNYTNIKTVTFEATMYTPTGNQTIYVRLYNATDKHPVWNSELSLDGGTAKLLTSPSITLDSGNKLYQVQMKTSLRYQAVLNQARLHILTK